MTDCILNMIDGFEKILMKGKGLLFSKVGFHSLDLFSASSHCNLQTKSMVRV